MATTRKKTSKRSTRATRAATETATNDAAGTSGDAEAGGEERDASQSANDVADAPEAAPDGGASESATEKPGSKPRIKRQIEDVTLYGVSIHGMNGPSERTGYVALLTTEEEGEDCRKFVEAKVSGQSQEARLHEVPAVVVQTTTSGSGRGSRPEIETKIFILDRHIDQPVDIDGGKFMAEFKARQSALAKLTDSEREALGIIG